MVMVFFVSDVLAELKIAEVSPQIQPAVFQEVSRIPEKPHFLLGLERKEDEWEQYLEQRKVFQIKDLAYGKNFSGIIDKSRDDYLARGNTELSEVIAMASREVRIFYTHHHFTKEGMYTFWSKMGEKNLAEFSPLYRKYEIQWGLGNISDEMWERIKQMMGWAQFEAVKLFMRSALEDGLARAVKTYTEMHLTEGVLEARAKLLEDPQYRDRLDEEVAGTDGLKVRDLLPVPLTRAEDFLPDIIIVGPRGFYGGMANFKTPGTERIVFLDLLGLVMWYTTKWPLVEHELVHTNPYLQSVPIAYYYDVEMWAGLTTDLDQGGLTEFLFHPYIAVVRDMVRTFFGYDFEEVRRRIFPGEFVVRDVREREFRLHAAEVKRIRDELMGFIKAPRDGFMVEFYTNPYYWLAVNTKFCDTAAVWRILFALRYEPAGLFDPNKKDKEGNVISPVHQTKAWLMKEEEAGRIRRLAEKAMKRTGEETKFAKEMPKVVARGKCPVHARFFLMKEHEQQEFIETVELLVKRMQRGESEAAFLLKRIFGNSGVLSGTTVR